jgi:hypothetical protein
MSKILGVILILALAWIGYDFYNHRNANERASEAIKGDSIAIIAVRAELSEVRERADSIRKSNDDLRATYAKFVLTPTRNTSRTDTVYAGDTVRITTIDTVEVIPDNVLAHIAQADTIIKNYSLLDARMVRMDSLHHDEIALITRQRDNFRIMFENEAAKNKNKGIVEKLIYTGIGYGIARLVNK